MRGKTQLDMLEGIDAELIRQFLLMTWVSAVAISAYARVPHRRALEIMRDMRDSGLIEMRDCRLDGHNPVLMVRLAGGE